MRPTPLRCVTLLLDELALEYKVRRMPRGPQGAYRGAYIDVHGTLSLQNAHRMVSNAANDTRLSDVGIRRGVSSTHITVFFGSDTPNFCGVDYTG